MSSLIAVDSNEELKHTEITNLSALLFFIDVSSFPVADSVMSSSSYNIARSIYLTSSESSRVKISDLYISSDGIHAIVRNVTAVPPFLEREWFNLLTHDLSAQYSIIFDGALLQTEDSESNPVLLKYIATSSLRNSPTLNNVEELQAGVLISGCSAMIINQMELQNKDAVLLLGHKRLQYSVESARSFVSAYSLLNSVLHADLLPPSKDSYLKYRKNDAYLLNTGNIYA
jgi:hypothetical protein